MDKVLQASDRASAIRGMGDDEVVQALAAVSRREHADAYLANVLATEAMNRVQRNDAITRTAAEALVSIDPSGIVAHANPAAFRILGLQPADLAGSHHHERLHLVRDDGEPVPLHECPIQRVLRTGEPVHQREVRLRRKGGEAFHALVSIAPIERDGRHDGAVLTFMDITQRKRAEEALVRERRRLYQILDNLTEGVLLLSPEGTYEYANPSALRMLQVPREELLGLQGAGRSFRVLDVQGSPLPFERWPSGRVLQTHARVRGERLFIDRKDGSRIAVDIDASPVQDEAGRFLGVVVSFDDITDRLRAEERDHILSSLVRSSQDAILHETPDGVILDWNAGAERMFGYARDEVVGQNVSMLVPKALRHELHDVNGRVARGEYVPPIETKRLRKDGSLVDVSLLISPVLDRSGSIATLSATYRDITRLKQAEARLQEELDRQQALFEILPDPIFTLDADGRVRALNPAAAGIVAAREALERPFDRLVDPVDREDAHRLVANALSGEQPRSRMRLRHKEGHALRCEVIGFPLMAAGRVQGAHVIARPTLNPSLARRIRDVV